MNGTYEVASILCSSYSSFRFNVIRMQNGCRNRMVTKTDEKINDTDFRAKSKKTLESVTYALNTFAASYLNTQGLNNSCLKSPASTLVDITFQSRALRSFSLNQLRNLSL